MQGEKMEKYYTSLTLKVNSIYDMLERAIRTQRLQALEVINVALTENLRRIQEIHDRSQRSKAQLEKFFSDIENNFDNIIREVEMGPFNDILSKYHQKLDLIRNDINSLRDNITINYIKLEESSGLIRAVEAGRLPSIVNLIPTASRLGTTASEQQSANYEESSQVENAVNKRRSHSSDFSTEGLSIFKNPVETKQCLSKPPVQQQLSRVQSQTIETVKQSKSKVGPQRDQELEQMLSGKKSPQSRGKYFSQKK